MPMYGKVNIYMKEQLVLEIEKLVSKHVWSVFIPGNILENLCEHHMKWQRDIRIGKGEKNRKLNSLQINLFFLDKSGGYLLGCLKCLVPCLLFLTVLSQSVPPLTFSCLIILQYLHDSFCSSLNAFIS